MRVSGEVPSNAPVVPVNDPIDVKVPPVVIFHAVPELPPVPPLAEVP